MTEEDGAISSAAYALYFSAPAGKAPDILRALYTIKEPPDIEVSEFFRTLAQEFKRRIYIEETPSQP